MPRCPRDLAAEVPREYLPPGLDHATVARMTPAEFATAAEDLARANGFDRDTAEQYLAFIGDTPELSETGDGRVVVRDDAGREIARVVLLEAVGSAEIKE